MLKRISIPFSISREERAQIQSAYLQAVDSADAEKTAYITEHLPRVLRRLRNSDEVWHVEMSEVASFFASLLRRDSGVSRTARKELVGALYYLCQPFEVIPDYVPGRGYADDALVLNSCMTRLRQLGVNLGPDPYNNLLIAEDPEDYAS
jgi:uncharacterized membrane protein YkvA (DUF1232 family)